MKPDDSLKQQLRRYYEAQSLPAERLEDLVAKTRQHDRKLSPGPGRRWLALAAGMLVALSAAWFGAQHVKHRELVEAVTQEIALNHFKQLEPDFVAGSMPELAAAMDELDFALVESAALGARDLEVVGARYCSIQGRLAAQLRLIDRTGRALTFYQAPLDGELSRLGDEEIVHAGLRVRLWPEDGLLLGLAESAEPQPAPTVRQ